MAAQGLTSWSLPERNLPVREAFLCLDCPPWRTPDRAICCGSAGPANSHAGSGHIAATAAMSYAACMLMPMRGRCVTSGCAPEKGEAEHLPPCDLVDTFIGPWCASTGTDGTRRSGTTASTGTTTRKDACRGSRLRSNGSKAEPVSVRVEKLRAWFAPADGEDALWLWLPRCSW